jgi:hypothetical protein
MRTDIARNFNCALTTAPPQSWVRRCKIVSIAKNFPVLIQSDESAIPFVKGFAALLETNVGMQISLARIPLCRAVLSVSPFCDMVHDRTKNALNGRCVAIAEDNLGSKGLLNHKINSLLFRYDDDSLEECQQASLQRLPYDVEPDMPFLFYQLVVDAPTAPTRGVRSRSNRC